MDKKVINSQIKFYYELTDTIFEGKTIVINDRSIIFIPDIDIGCFELYLSDWKFCIRTGSIGKNELRYLTGYFFENETVKCQLKKPESKKGRVYFETDLELIYGIHYEEIYSFSQKTYFDKNTNWLALGDIYTKGEAIEFASNNIAIINEENDLIAIYVKLVKE